MLVPTRVLLLELLGHVVLLVCIGAWRRRVAWTALRLTVGLCCVDGTLLGDAVELLGWRSTLLDGAELL